MKKIKNFNLLKDTVSTHYGDFEGLVSIDAQDSFSKLLLQHHEIPLNRHVVGFGFNFGETKDLATVSCHVYVLDEKYGIEFDAIRNAIMDLDSVEVDDIRFYIPVQDLGKYIKRFDCMAVSDMGNYIDAFNKK